MTILKQVQSALRNLPWLKKAKTSDPEQHLLNADQQIQSLLTDSVPSAVKQELFKEFAEIEAISEKLQHSEIHIAAFGRVGTGKSSLLNALLGRQVFSTSPLHGETRCQQRSQWDTVNSDHVVLIDTPGIDELDGEAREEMARSVARISDIVLMVCEGDLTETEFKAVRSLAQRKRPLLLVLNKSDRYGVGELESLLEHLRDRCVGFIEPDNILSASADPRPEQVIRIDETGNEHPSERPRSPDVSGLKTQLWNILETEGKTLAALNAALFTSELDGRIAAKIVHARKAIAEKIISNYCLAKALVVAVNPVPVTDLLAAAGTDVAMVIHLGNVYGFQLSRREASKLLLTISAQMLLLMGAYWGVNMVSSAMKTISAGMSATLTAGVQGALAWYATYVTGHAAETWFAKGKSWGSAGPKETINEILASLDQESLLKSALDIQGKHSGSGRDRRSGTTNA
jgi:small GTP-binding protein